jgi:hypothetical protein
MAEHDVTHFEVGRGNFNEPVIALSKDLDHLAVLGLIRLIPSVVLKSLSNHRDYEHEDERVDGGDWAEWRHNGDALQNGHREEVEVGEAEELVEQTEGQEREASVLGGPNVVGHELLHLIGPSVIDIDLPGGGRWLSVGYPPQNGGSGLVSFGVAAAFSQRRLGGFGN